jgi:endoplasmic reticulum chaperone BiP
MSKMIPKETYLPVKVKQLFTTAWDNQETATISVFEGERPLTKDNYFLGRFDITGIPPAPKGTIQIEVTFLVEFQSLITVTAVEIGSGNNNSIVIKYEGNCLSKNFTRILMEAEENAEADKLIQESIDTGLRLEGY